MTAAERWVIALTGVTIGGTIVIGPILGLMRLMTRIAFPPGVRWKKWIEFSFGWLTLVLGSTERAVAMVLFAYAPSYLLPFIAGWWRLSMLQAGSKSMVRTVEQKRSWR